MFSTIIPTVTASVKINSQERETAASNNSHINNSNDKGDQSLHGGGSSSNSNSSRAAAAEHNDKDRSHNKCEFRRRDICIYVLDELRTGNLQVLIIQYFC
jgi:hypothetical protein